MTSKKPTAEERRAFGRRLAAARKAKGWTQGQLATACGVSDGMVVSKWENGVNLPGDAAPWVLLEVFGYETFVGLWGQRVEPQVVEVRGHLSGSPDERAAQAARLLEQIAQELGRPDRTSS